MNLKVGKSNGRTYLSIAHGYMDENGKVRTKTVKSLGYLEDLAKDYPDPIAHSSFIGKQPVALVLQALHESIPMSAH